MFPVEEEATVVNFMAEIDGRTIDTEVQDSQKARETYNKTVAMGKSAVLLEETTPEIFRIKLGQLKPGAEAKLTVVYISELPAEDTAVRLTIPTTIAPRYVPPADNSEAAKVTSAIPYSTNSPAPLSFDLEVLSQHEIKAIKSSSHSLKAEMISGKNEDGQFYAKATIAGKTSDLDRDIVVLIENSSPHEPMVFIEKSEDLMLAGMVSLVPSFKLKDQAVELIFLVDRSGSMGGTSIEQAKKALELFLHSLPTDCYFNIFSFGSTFDSLFEKSEKYDDHTLFLAKMHVSKMSADYGGTEILQPFKAIFAESPKPDFLRQIFVLTDGGVSNADNVIDLVKRNCEYGRVFALGLGASVSRHLVKGIARAGGGTAVFATDSEDLRPKVLSQLKNAIQPSIFEVEIIWNGVSVNKPELVEQPEIETQKTLLGFMKPKKSSNAKKVLHLDGQAPLKIPPIYDGSRLLVYHLFLENETTIPKSVTINAKTPDGLLSVELPIGRSCMVGGNFVHQLAARKKIQDLAEIVIGDHGITEEEIKNAIIRLGINYKLASKYTSFVGVDKKEPNSSFELEMVTREINNQVPFGFGTIKKRSSNHPYLTSVDCCLKVDGFNYNGFSPKNGSSPLIAKPSLDCPRSIQGKAHPRESRETSKSYEDPIYDYDQKCLNNLIDENNYQKIMPQNKCLKSARINYFGCGLRASKGFFTSLLKKKPKSVSTGDSNGFAEARRNYMGLCHGKGTFSDLEDSSKEALFKNMSVEPVLFLRKEKSSDLEVTTAKTEVQLSSLINLQAADGHFNWGDVFLSCLGKSQSDIVSACPKYTKKDCWITALAIVVLENLVDQKDLWELVVLKAKKFIAKQMKDGEKEKLMNAANHFVQ